MHTVVRLTLLCSGLAGLLLIQGCAPVTTRDEAKPSQAEIAFQNQVASLLDAGDHALAAQLLVSKAELSGPEKANPLILQAAEILAQTEDWNRVQALLERLQPPLDTSLLLRRRMLAIELAIWQRDVDRALALMQPPPGPDTALALRQRYHRNQAEVYRLTGNLLESARALDTLDSLLQDTQARLENQQKLVQTLSTLTDTALSELQPEPAGSLGGWMELVRLFKRRNQDPTNFESRVEAWREQHPEHPALPQLVNRYVEQKVIDQSSHIAVLLPRSGPYAKVAAAVREGFMAAWYQRPIENRPALRFYDSSDPQHILDLYQKAVQHGAQLVVGPLDKTAVGRLQQAEELPMPILALNQVDQPHPPANNLFQFGLSPEEEAEQAAERAWLDGHTLALALAPDDDWGRRLYQSFKARWEALGGRLLEHQTYDPSENDHSQPIRRLLNIDESEARKQDLQRIVGVSMEAEPHRRTDAQFIFLAARAQQGRQLRPQLKFYHAEDLPVYTTSHIYNSAGYQERDQDLGHIKFVDTPWLLEQDSQSELSRQALQRIMPGVGGSYARFYAMGIDAFNLLPHLNLMIYRAGPLLHGKTGNLYMDSSHRIHRQLAWAELDEGEAKISGYAPRLESAAQTPPRRTSLEAEAPRQGVPTAPGAQPVDTEGLR